MQQDADGLGFDALESAAAAAQKQKAAVALDPDADDDEAQAPSSAKGSKKGKQRAQPQPSTSAKNVKAATGKRHAAKNAGSRAKSKDAADSQEPGCKRCKDCKKSLPEASFYQDQAMCKDCSKESRNVANIAKNQDCLPWFRSLSENEKAELLRSYRKAKEKAHKERSKLKFCLKTYRETVRAQQGQRFERRRRLMSEAQYIKYAMLEEDLTKSQAGAKWQEMLQSKEYRKEGTAPKQKIYVPMAKDLLDYHDVGASLRTVEHETFVKSSRLLCVCLQQVSLNDVGQTGFADTANM